MRSGYCYYSVHVIGLNLHQSDYIFFADFNMTSHKLIVFKSVVWKKGDERFRKIAILGLGVESKHIYFFTIFTCITILRLPKGIRN